MGTDSDIFGFTADTGSNLSLGQINCDMRGVREIGACGELGSSAAPSVPDLIRSVFAGHMATESTSTVAAAATPQDTQSFLARVTTGSDVITAST